MSNRVELKRDLVPVRVPTEWFELTLKADELNASGTTKQLAALLTEATSFVDSTLFALFEPHFDLKSLTHRDHPRLFLGGASAHSVAAELIRRGWAQSRSPRKVLLTVDLFKTLRQVLFVQDRRVVLLQGSLTNKDKEALAHAGLSVDYTAGFSTLLVPMDLPGKRGRVRLSYGFGCIDVLAASKDEARGLVRLLRDELPAGADDPLALREARARTDTAAASIVELIEDPALGAKEAGGAYARRWSNQSGTAVRSLERGRPGPVTKPSNTPPRKSGPFGQERRRKN